jgi:TetR/AcrR family transcriptional regulator, transcriptional repressor for nem operon
VKDASRRVRSRGLNGAAVAAVMHDTGLTHGGFYKHFKSRDELLIESLGEAFRDVGDKLARAAQGAKGEAAWKSIVKTYLSLEFCDHPERGCPLPALAPELTRVDAKMARRILSELVIYKNRMVQFMPGRRASEKERAFFAIFSTMTGAIEIARMLPEPAMRKKVLASARDFLLRSF